MKGWIMTLSGPHSQIRKAWGHMVGNRPNTLHELSDKPHWQSHQVALLTHLPKDRRSVIVNLNKTLIPLKTKPEGPKDPSDYWRPSLTSLRMQRTWFHSVCLAFPRVDLQFLGEAMHAPPYCLHCIHMENAFSWIKVCACGVISGILPQLLLENKSNCHKGLNYNLD